MAVQISTRDINTCPPDTLPLVFEVCWTFDEEKEMMVGRAYTILSLRPAPQCDWDVTLRRVRKHPFDELVLEVENKVSGYAVWANVALSIHDSNNEVLWRNAANDRLLAQRSTVHFEIPRDTVEFENKQGMELKRIHLRFLIKQAVTSSDEALDLAAWRESTRARMIEELTAFVLDKHPDSVVLTTDDGGRLPANRALLCLRSPVFARMFEHHTLERQEETVLIKDLSGDTVKNLVEFLTRSGELELSMRFADLKELYYAADKYEVLDLREMCAKGLVRVLSRKTVGQVLDMAERHSDKVLLAGCARFVVEANCMKYIGTKHREMVTSAQLDPNLGVTDQHRQNTIKRRIERPMGRRRCSTASMKRQRTIGK